MLGGAHVDGPDRLTLLRVPTLSAPHARGRSAVSESVALGAGLRPPRTWTVPDDVAAGKEQEAPAPTHVDGPGTPKPRATEARSDPHARGRSLADYLPAVNWDLRPARMWTVRVEDPVRARLPPPARTHVDGPFVARLPATGRAPACAPAPWYVDGPGVFAAADPPFEAPG